MFKQQMLGPLQTDCLLGIITASTRRCIVQRPQNRRKCFLQILTVYIKMVLTALVTAKACELWSLRAMCPCMQITLLCRQTSWRWVRKSVSDARAGHEVHRRNCFSTHPFRRYTVTIARGRSFLPPHGDRRIFRDHCWIWALPALARAAPLTAGQARHTKSLPHGTDEASSSRACMLHSLSDVRGKNAQI